MMVASIGRRELTWEAGERGRSARVKTLAIAPIVLSRLATVVALGF